MMILSSQLLHLFPTTTTPSFSEAPAAPIQQHASKTCYCMRSVVMLPWVHLEHFHRNSSPTQPVPEIWKPLQQRQIITIVIIKRMIKQRTGSNNTAPLPSNNHQGHSCYNWDVLCAIMFGIGTSSLGLDFGLWTKPKPLFSHTFE